VIRPRKHLENLERHKQGWDTRADSLRLELNEIVPHIDEYVFTKIMGAVKPWMFSAYADMNPVYMALARALKMSEDHFVLTNGADTGIRQVLEVFCDLGDEIIVPFPTYEFYRIYAEILNLKCVKVKYSNEFELSVGEIFNSIKPATKVIAIANPNGAIGCVMEAHDLELIIDKASENGAIVLLDEAYIDYYGESWINRVDEFDNLVVLRTFSKAGGLAGLRFGYIVTNPEIRKWLYKTMPNVEINSMAALAGRYLLENPDVIDYAVKKTLEGKSYLLNALKDLGLGGYAGYANFILVKFGAKRKKILEALHNEKIRVKDCAGDELLDEYTRITVGPREYMEKLVGIIKSI
jgi:histidinol-phosphate aminotransferase